MQEINKLLKLTFIHKCRLFLIFQQTDQLVEDFSTDWGNRELTLKNIKKVKWVCGWGGGEFGKLSLVYREEKLS